MELPITGYANRLSVRAGDRIEFKVSTIASRFVARIVKLHRDPDLSEPIPSPADGDYPGELQPIRTGSFATLDDPPQSWPADIVTRFVMSPTKLEQQDAGVITFGERKGLFLDGDQLVLRMEDAEARSSFRLRKGAWYHITTSFHPAEGKIRLAVSAAGMPISVAEAVARLPERLSPADFRVAAVAGAEGEHSHFDGKVASIAVSSFTSSLIASWDFGANFSSFLLPDTSGNGLTLRLCQSPRRAVTGPAWNGEVHDPRLAPAHYDAIAFHSDDLTDAGWRTSVTLQIPEDWQSGIYALEVTGGGGTDHIPFFLRRRVASPPARLAFLVPTFSYLAYANERHWWSLPDIKARTGKDARELVSPAELWAEDARLLSCYDRHSDLTGCAHSSFLRPIVNMRSGYRHPYVAAPHQLSADLYITDWLEAQGYDFDIVTDHDLDREGAKALAGYASVLTGSHPEYVSAGVLDALTTFNRRGGHLAYLGGNGFYCAVSVYPEAPHVMELRRGHAGGMHWKSPIGEAFHAATGEPGGHWRLRGRSSHVLFGIGTISVMFDRGSPFVRTEASRQPAVAWIFEGVEGDHIDTESIVLGQPGGFEVDQISFEEGTPANAIRLASAYFEPPVTAYQYAESQWNGILPENRADLVFIPGQGQGDVFSVGSIAWTGCLWTDGGNNKVSRIMANVISRFATARSDSDD